MLHADRPAGQKDPHTEVFKIMHPTGVALDLLDPAVKPFAGGVGSSILPGIQDSSAETLDAAGGAAQLRDFGREMPGDPFGEQEALDGKLRLLEDRMEVLEGVIHAADVRGKDEDPVETLELLPCMAFPVGFLVLLSGSEQAGGMLEEGIRDGIALKAEGILDADPQVIHPLVEQADDVQVVIADDGPGEAGRSEFGKAGVHVAADEADFGALLERELEEIIPEGAMVNGGEDVKDSATIGIGNVAVVFISIVVLPRGIPGTGRALKLIDADSLGKADLPILDELFHHGKDNVAGGEGIHSDIMDGSDGPIEPGADGEEEVSGDAEAGVDKVRPDSKRPATVFAGKAAGTEGEKDAAAVRVCRVADGDRPGLALGDRMAAAAGRAGRVQGPGIRDEKFGGVVMTDSFGNVSFRGQTGKVVGDI